MINHKFFDTPEQVVESLANDLNQISEQETPAHISLSGGRTPKMLFKRLAKKYYAKSINRQNLQFWWYDERCVAPDDEQSNYGEAKALLFDHIEIPAENIHRILGENNPKTEADRFASEMTPRVEIPLKI